MELSRLLDELIRAATRVGIAVRSETFDPNLSDARNPRGGLCTVLGRRVILVDANASVPDRIATLATALSRVDLEGIYLAPIVRATIGAHAHPSAFRWGSGSPDGALRPKPQAGAGAPRGEAHVAPLPLVRTRWRGPQS